MKSSQWHLGGLLVAILLVPAPASARPLSVEVSTDRGHEGVYQPGQSLEIRTRASEDAYLLVYEIDAEGYLHLLYPHRPNDIGRVEGGSRYRLPEDDADELVAQGPTGQGYIVAHRGDRTVPRAALVSAALRRARRGDRLQRRTRR